MSVPPATYTKQWLSLADQLALVKSRGLQVRDDIAAIECLHRNGYYRLSAYWYPFRRILPGSPANTRSNSFLPDSYFEDALELYKFDKRLKLHLLDGLERVEVAARVEIAYTMGKRDIFALYNPSEFNGDFQRLKSRRHGAATSDHAEWLAKFARLVEKSKDDFMVHHERTYGDRSRLPIWIAIEVWDFGLLNFAYKIAIATRFDVPVWRLMQSWLANLNYVRNVIAHHGRLWNFYFPQATALPSPGQMPSFDPLLSVPQVQNKLYAICCILAHMSKVVNPGSAWVTELKGIIKNFPAMPHASIQNMGFPVDWENHIFLQ